MSQLFPSGGQSIGVSASTSVLPMNNQDLFPLGWTDWISLQSKGLSRVFSNTVVQKFSSSALSFLYSPTLTYLHNYWKNHSLDQMDLCWKSNTCFLICCLGWSYKIFIHIIYTIYMFYMIFVVIVQLLSCVWLIATPRTGTHKTSLSMRFPRQLYWSRLPFLSYGLFLIRVSDPCFLHWHLHLCAVMWGYVYQKEEARLSTSHKGTLWINISCTHHNRVNKDNICFLSTVLTNQVFLFYWGITAL